MEEKLNIIKQRFTELSDLIIQPDIISDQKKYVKISKEYKDLKEIVDKINEYNTVKENIHEAEEILKSESDKEMIELASSELSSNKDLINEIEEDLKIMLIPKDPDDSKNIVMELRAGTGGDEASIFAGDLFRMYSRLAEREGWNVDVIDIKQAEQGGLREVVAQLNGKSVFKVLKFESGVHRVQRVPETESQGRIHTSTCTVAILPEVEEVQEIQIDKNDLRVDTFRASGAGGQHVNKTDSAVRLTHIPSGLVVECQDGRSQHKNKEKALSLLASKLKQAEIESQQESIASERKILVGTGDRSEKIRTYNFPQGRMTDHRIKLTQHNLDQIMDGDIKSICDALLAENQLAMLSQLESE